MRELSEKYFPVIEKFKSLPRGSVTVERFCWQHSINTKTFYYWKKKYEAKRGQGLPAGKQGFLPVVIDKTSSVKSGSITVQYADGTRVVFEGAANSSLIKELLPLFSK
jgi:transposase-like protein